MRVGYLQNKARYGVPDTIVSDKGTQFTANEFKNHCNMYPIQHNTTPLYFATSNVQVERLVDSFKRALKESRNALLDDAVLIQFLKVYRLKPKPNTFSGNRLHK